MRGGIVKERCRFPGCPGLCRTLQHVDGAGCLTVTGFAGIPLGSHRYFHFSIIIDIGSGNADIIPKRQVLEHRMLFPGRVLEPGKLAFVGQEDVDFAVSIDVTNGNAVSDLHFTVDHLGLKGGFLLSRRPRSGNQRNENKCR